MKILWKGNIFNPTGIATAGREWVKALVKRGHKIQVSDIWHDGWEFNKGLEFLNSPININDPEIVTIFWDYPMFWREGRGTIIGGFVHEGTKLFEDWPYYINKADAVFVPSKAVKNLAKWNGVTKRIEVIPHGVSEVYKPNPEYNKEGTFVFLSVNSWTGEEGDRKGTDLLIKAFDEEFKEEDVRLVLKMGNFSFAPYNVAKKIEKIIGHINEKILVNTKYATEEELATYYQRSHCFVAPTRGEGFGLTILNALACGLPVIVTKDNNSGHMDFCRGHPAVLWVDAPKVAQGDPKFYCEGNMLAEPDINSLKKQMRYAYENWKELNEKAKIESDRIRQEWSWDRAAEKLENYINEVKNEVKNENTQLWR